MPKISPAPPEPISSPEPRQKRIPERINLSDESCKPGLSLMERIAHSRQPTAEDLAILDSWKFSFPVRVATAKEMEQF